nr:helix-turn-helix domain-containing protein [Bradyrhizobium symbiodeficiens]
MLLLGPTSRRDIGDYLGLTLETVSREISILRDAGLLRFVGTTQRQLSLLNREELSRYDS